MSGALSKRQQARNERTLQELIKSVPGNSVCADCQARNPGWASWSLGIFLCMRCAALHRKLGTHITKVKSLSMDSWSNDQVENMKRIGNVVSNQTYNPQNSRPPIPIDADEADSAMERFIRQKYQERTIQAPMRNNTGSTNSDDHPPPLPPKTGSRFGFRSASSIFPLSSKAKKEAQKEARQNYEVSRERSPSPIRRKSSRIFGNNVGSDESQDLDPKLAKLREMGFLDEKRNIAVLKGLSGNLEKSIETLARLGEGTGPPRPPKDDHSGPPSRARTPMSPPAGLTINRTRGKSPPKSSNPFDMLDALPPPPAQPQSSQSTGSLAQPQSQNPYQHTTNPFGLMPSQSQVNLNQSFQNMAISNSQPLFPNHTGGFPGPQPSQQQQLYQQSMTPPVPSLPQQYYPPVIYENPTQQMQPAPQQQQNHSYNPFMQQQQQQPQQPQEPQRAPSLNTNLQSNPFLQQQQLQGQNVYQSPLEQSPLQYSPQQFSPQQYRSVSAFHSHQNQPQPQSNPFLQNNQSSVHQVQNQQSYDLQSQQQQQFQQVRQQTYPLMPQQTGRADKRSILDLYNYPQLAPSAPQQFQPQQQETAQQPSMATPSNITPQQPRSVSSPLATQIAGSRNPFMTNGTVQSPGEPGGNLGPFAPNQNGARHVSQESVSIDAGWQNGRHSPDAWGTISARSTR